MSTGGTTTTLVNHLIFKGFIFCIAIFARLLYYLFRNHFTEKAKKFYCNIAILQPPGIIEFIF